MANKVIWFILVGVLLLASNVLAVNFCSENEYCPGRTLNDGSCDIDCELTSEQSGNPSSSFCDSAVIGKICDLFSIDFLMRKIREGFDKLTTPLTTLFHDKLILGAPGSPPNPYGYKKLYDFTFKISILFATALLIISTIYYMVKMSKSNSSTSEILELKQQIIKTAILMMLLFSLGYLVTLGLEGIKSLNYSIQSELSYEPSWSFFNALFAGAGIFLAFFIATLGTGAIVIAMLIFGFFFIVGLRLLVIHILLAILPLALVFYFFTPTERIGKQIFMLTIANLITFTIWMVIFAVADDMSENPTFLIGDRINGIDGLFMLIAMFINTFLYFKINQFFVSLAAQPISGTNIIMKKYVTDKRVATWKKSVSDKFAGRKQTTLKGYV